ncbi:MAG: indole-3-glycerol phosphate synthase TrpC [Chloroflexota bacterium]|nr:indole-3-glycerol phosphate synthase TrpC [Chloroflexota bacterium]
MILDEIVQSKKESLERRKRELPLSELKRRCADMRRKPVDFASALCGDDIKLIAEVKKASPSRGTINADIDPVKLATTYAANGAAAISILTEEKHFKGSIDCLEATRNSFDDGGIAVPLLRKDFIFDLYQIYESKACGADALLLIAAILDDDTLSRLLSLSHDLGMKCLIEAHDGNEIERAVSSGARIIGINNRDLQTFDVDLHTTARLRRLVPNDRIVVSESGIRHRTDVEKLTKWNVDAMLVGEALSTSADVPEKIKELLS